MLDVYFQDLESLEAINQDADTREVVLRMAGLAHVGRLGTFVHVVHADAELDEHTKEWVLEIAKDETFLLAADEYFVRCGTLH